MRRRRAADGVHGSSKAYLAAEKAITPMSDASMKGVVAAMSVFSKIVLASRTDLRADYFTHRPRRLVPCRCRQCHDPEGPDRANKASLGSDPEDDELRKAKALDAFDGHGCVVDSETQPALRILMGNQQVGRIKHNILVVGPDLGDTRAVVKSEQPA